MKEKYCFNGMDIKILVVGMCDTNCYILSSQKTKEAIIIDPGDFADQIEGYIEKRNLIPVGILLTHGHFDHIYGVEQLARNYQIKVYVQKEEKILLEDARMNCSKMVGREATMIADVFLEDRETIELGEFSIMVIHTPGHTLGSSCFYVQRKTEDSSENELSNATDCQAVLFSGDTLFFESVGRTDLPSGNGQQIIKMIQEKLMNLEDSLLVLPGHGVSTTIGYERKNNPYLGD